MRGLLCIYFHCSENDPSNRQLFGRIPEMNLSPADEEMRGTADSSWCSGWQRARQERCGGVIDQTHFGFASISPKGLATSLRKPCITLRLRERRCLGVDFVSRRFGVASVVTGLQHPRRLGDGPRCPSQRAGCSRQVLSTSPFGARDEGAAGLKAEDDGTGS